jgi:hypothetical protein
MKLELDDDFADEITRTNLANSYVNVSRMLKNGNNWHEDDVTAWKKLLPALKIVGGWYSVDFDDEIKKVKKAKK